MDSIDAFDASIELGTSTTPSRRPPIMWHSWFTSSGFEARSSSMDSSTSYLISTNWCCRIKSLRRFAMRARGMMPAPDDHGSGRRVGSLTGSWVNGVNDCELSMVVWGHAGCSQILVVQSSLELLGG